jgi:hypothetical protein
MTAEHSPLIDLLPPGSEVKDTKQPTDSVTREASSEQDIRLTIKLFEEANRRQDERIQQLEKDLAEPKNLATFISKYRFLFCTLVVVIVWLVIHCWNLYRSAMDRRFEDAQQIQILVLEQKINELSRNYCQTQVNFSGKNFGNALQLDGTNINQSIPRSTNK